MSEELKAVAAEMLAKADGIVASAEAGQLWSHQKTEVDALRYWAARIEAATAPMSGLSGEEREALADLVTHREAWERGIQLAGAAIASGIDPEEREADESYWQHELRAFQRTFAQLPAIACRLATAPADSLGVDEAMVERGLNAARDASDARLPRYSVVRAILTAALGERHESE